MDHGLRPEAAAEAAGVAALCRAHGIAHRTLSWRGPKPRDGVIAAAREARYDLLAEAAGAVGADIVLTAHTFDDQAETVAMRAARGEGSGLAGMAAATLFDSRVWIVRPLLGLRRQALRDWLSARGVTWVDDPSNADPAFERVRVRRRLDEGAISALARQARQQGAARTALATKAAGLVSRFASCPVPGLYRLERDLFGADVDAEPALLVLRTVLATAGGTAHLPERARAQALFSQLAQGAARRATLSRVVVDMRSSGLFLHREARDLPVVTLTGRQVLWDGRFRVEGPAGLSVGPSGKAAATDMAAKGGPGRADVPASLARAALAASPAIFRGGEAAGPATGGDALAQGVTATAVIAPFARFLPGFDLALAAALGRLAGAPALPPPPWKHHIADGA